MNTSVSKSRLYDVAKCITTILVVVAHATRMYTPAGAIPAAKQSAFLRNFTNYVYVFHMPLFVMLSGCVFGYCIERGKYSDVLAFVKNKGKRLLIPYAAFGILYVAPVMHMLRLTNLGYMSYVVNGIVLSKDSRHLWYLLALFWIFLICILMRPLLIKGTKGLVISGAVSLLLFAASGCMPNVLQLSAACNYQLFFFAGILFNRFYSDIERLFHKFRMIGYLLPAALLMMFVSNPNMLTEYAYKGIGLVMMMFICWALLCRFPDVLGHPILKRIKQNSFGIYLFHPMIIYVLFALLGKRDISPIFLSVFASAAAILLSVYATGLMRKLRLHLLIGE
ncbi:MAG: acyltransferase [Clostridiales bacterium]|nr:acyltransferase [Clostridiales bacterium]